MNFDITALTESRIKKNSVFPINIELGNYSIEQTPAEIAAGGALLYISKRLPYQNNFNIYMPGQFESILIEILRPKSSNIIVRCIYKKHLSLHVNNFTNDIILPLLGKLNKESSKKNIFLGDFNIDLLQYETFEPVNSFVDIFSSNFVSPLTLLPTRISNSTSTLIDNIFCNVTFNSDIISENFTSAVSDHVPQQRKCKFIS